jgi:branched-chain amino acid transport system substrate-binding protein
MGTKMRLGCVWVVSLLMAVLLTGTGWAGDEIVVGVVHWEDFAYAAMMKNSYDMAVEAVNANGGIKGRKLKLVWADDQGSRRGGEQAVAQLVKTLGARMLIGGYASSNTLYTARAANRLGIPFLVCTAADDRITQRELSHVFRLNLPASAYANGLESFLLEKVQPRSMAIVYENSPYGTSGAMKMMWFCRENDIELTAIIPYFRERAAAPDYFKRILVPLKSKPPDVIYMVSYLKDGVELVGNIRRMDTKALLCGGAGGFTHYKFIEKTGANGEGLVTAALWGPETEFRGARAYFDDYVERFQNPPDYHGAEAYSAVLVAAEALGKARDLQPENIRAALANIAMETPFGPVRFAAQDNYERQNWIEPLVFQIIEDRFQCIWPSRLARQAFTPPPYWRAVRTASPPAEPANLSMSAPKP